MRVLKNPMRYDLLAEQFYAGKRSSVNNDIVKSNERILHFIYSQTDIYYLEDVDSTTLYNYIKFQSTNQRNRNKLCLTGIIKDIRHFLLFLRTSLKLEKIPSIK